MRVELEKENPFFLDQVSRCPIIPSFFGAVGEVAGTGTFMVGAGPYWIEEFRPGRYLRLQRFSRYIRAGERAKRLEIRLIRDTIQALQGLRSGSLVAVLVNGEREMYRAVEDDPTLVVSHCSFGEVIHRRNVSWRCDPDIDLRELRYVS